MFCSVAKAPYVAAQQRRRKRGEGIFHAAGCNYVARMAKPRREYLTRREAIADGGRACLRCKP